jgi:hypothetical protein
MRVSIATSSPLDRDSGAVTAGAYTARTFRNAQDSAPPRPTDRDLGIEALDEYVQITPLAGLEGPSSKDARSSARLFSIPSVIVTSHS